MKSLIFDTSLQSSHTLLIPFEIAEPFIINNQKRVIVKVSFKDTYIEFHAALIKRNDQFFVMFSQKKQKQLGILPNDSFKVQLFEDNSKYGVEMPEELDAVLQSDPEASDIFESFTDGMKRSLIYYVLQFKNSQTRIDKSLIITENLKLGIRDKRQLIKKL
ncbi:Bacteriocin-protection, YdeI or OmpD-Associated [Aquimarina amphilecti]|uniref:Bacteriocin-protection, YdeI or OmpD-Associated n=1 Tax=Aquimarina amphilecti TaxID=1038014 RepID=A0A1H7Q161_AQUAM|nr:YdeI/OmpD-associated family protein [Aquimarina amphilecti]SEL41820.1 Bacteriocin-protection, YdeI or OmpD-Associated [Aquimarina amphilecti]